MPNTTTNIIKFNVLDYYCLGNPTIALRNSSHQMHVYGNWN